MDWPIGSRVNSWGWKASAGVEEWKWRSLAEKVHPYLKLCLSRAIFLRSVMCLGLLCCLYQRGCVRSCRQNCVWRTSVGRLWQQISVHLWTAHATMNFRCAAPHSESRGIDNSLQVLSPLRTGEEGGVRHHYITLFYAVHTSYWYCNSQIYPTHLLLSLVLNIGTQSERRVKPSFAFRVEVWLPRSIKS